MSLDKVKDQGTVNIVLLYNKFPFDLSTININSRVYKYQRLKY